MAKTAASHTVDPSSIPSCAPQMSYNILSGKNVVKGEFRAPPCKNGCKQGLKHEGCFSRRVPGDSRAHGLAH